LSILHQYIYNNIRKKGEVGAMQTHLRNILRCGASQWCNLELDICIHQPTLSFYEIIILLQKATFVVPWGSFNRNVQNNVFFPPILWFGNFGNFWKTIANFFLTFTLYKLKLQMFLDCFCSHNDPRPFLQVHEVTLLLGNLQIYEKWVANMYKKTNHWVKVHYKVAILGTFTIGM
jgi:putative component of membrane protein insertase Oxa1/YidC/SpoIIIJ protein YidD